MPGTPPPHFPPYPPAAAEKAKQRKPLSARAVAIAIAALATRGVSPGTPAMAPLVIEPETSSASMCVLPVGSMLLNAR